MQTRGAAERPNNQARLGRFVSNTDALHGKTRHGKPLGRDVGTRDCETSQRYWNGNVSEFGHSLSFNSLSFNCHATPPTKALKSSETGSSADRREGGLLDRDLDIRVGLAGDRTGLSAGDVERRIAAILWKSQWREEAVKQRTALANQSNQSRVECGEFPHPLGCRLVLGVTLTHSGFQEAGLTRGSEKGLPYSPWIDPASNRGYREYQEGFLIPPGNNPAATRMLRRMRVPMGQSSVVQVVMLIIPFNFHNSHNC